MDPDRAVADDIESIAPAPVQGEVPIDSRPTSSSQKGEAKQAFYQMMNDWFTQYIRTNSAVQQPPSQNNSSPIPVIPLIVDPMRLSRPPVDKIRKYGAEEFRATVNDDAERAEFWLYNTIRVFEGLTCTPEECLKYVISLLRDSAYHWWNTLVSGRMTVTEYEREFVRLSIYARECVSTEAVMCKRFEDGLNEDIKLLVGILEIKEFVVLVERACKAEELGKEKRKADFEARDSRKRTFNKPFQSTSKKLREDHSRSKATLGFSRRDPDRPLLSSRATSGASVGNVQQNISECKHCGKWYPRDCRLHDRSCFKCGSKDHFIRE
ncbi:uncharacterized protein LOC105771828 [Gossypium raimondii]|uniref:uncharacterized protein LOC105771828 n=1 Tax=Gossypium raimondii TaxID=29730 RepID=UPI00063AB6A7|nr:uncharacterized protein LOC105771828 [Gossypium raimondii]